MIKGNYDAARDAFHAALAADPQLDAAYVGMAQTYAARQTTSRPFAFLKLRARTPRPLPAGVLLWPVGQSLGP